MKVNHKQMYLMLKQQQAALQAQLSPAEAASEQVNELPENFNQNGWDTTIEKVELMLSKMKALREIKGKRLTPQFYRSIYNRALIANGEIDKATQSLTAAIVPDVDFAAECVKLNAEIYNLNILVAEKVAADEAAAAAADEAAAAAAQAGEEITAQ